jgi:hypothetical protein
MKSLLLSSGKTKTMMSPLREGDVIAVEELVHEDVVADQQRVFHGAGRDLERLDDQGPDDEGDQQRDGERLDVLAYLPFPFRDASGDTFRLHGRFLFQRHVSP